MPDEPAASPLTPARIKRILELHRDLSRKTRKDAKRMLPVERAPDMRRGETLTDVVAPEMARYFAGTDEDPQEFFKDRDRLLMITHAIKTGGRSALIERYRQLAKGEWVAAGIRHMREKGLGNPAAAQELLQHTLGNAERQVKQLQSVSDAEEQVVRDCMPEVEAMLFRKRTPSRA
jgi:hypothetical protein